MDHPVASTPTLSAQPLCVPLDPAIDPLELLARVTTRRYPALLDGASHHDGLGRWSYLAWDPVAVVHASAEEWPEVEDLIRATLGAHSPPPQDGPPFRGGWIGWFGYELGRAFDRQPVPARDDVGAPAVALALYDTVVAWDHLTGNCWLVSNGITADGAIDQVRARERLLQLAEECHAPVRDSPPQTSGPSLAGDHGITAFREAPSGLRGDFTAEGYQDAVDRVIAYVLAGDLFQANIAQRFVAPWTGSALELYRRIRDRTPAALGACLDHGSHAALSASPELFLAFESGTRQVTTRPIKGTRPRGRTTKDDRELADALSESAKDRAENVMIVDLLRNDLARVAVTGSVKVPVLAELETHPAVHHLVSTVTAEVRQGLDALDLLRATFPGGSITGAPKIRAMEIIAELEPVARGVYCGAIGWLALDGSMMLNLAIRTVTLTGGTAAIHAGGGITARSIASEEYAETLDKARGLIAALLEQP